MYASDNESEIEYSPEASDIEESIEDPTQFDASGLAQQLETFHFSSEDTSQAQPLFTNIRETHYEVINF